MINPIYQFYVNGRQIRPNYKSDLSKDFELENNQMFFREKLSSSITIYKDDYDFIAQQPFDTVFNFEIKISYDFGQTWQDNYYRGKFMKTDCKWNDDDKSLSVQPEPIDDYSDVINSLDKEYDLIKLAPEIEHISIIKRPMIQVYIPGDSVISCFLGGTYWEQDAEQITNASDLVTKYYFALSNMLKEINVTVTGQHAAASGLYTGRMSISVNGPEEKFLGEFNHPTNSNYKLRIEQTKLNPGWATFGGILVQLIRTSDNTVIFEFGQVSFEDGYDNLDFAFTPKNGATGTANGEMATYRIYTRYVLDVDNIKGLNTYNIPAEDITDNNRNYKKVIGYNFDVTFISRNFSATPTEWGLADNGQYFMPPYSIFGQTFYPIARSTWRYASIWFAFDLFDQYLEIDARKSYVLRDAFKLSSCIDKLLQQFSTTRHFDTSDYSNILYDAGSFNQLYAQRLKLYISQKSNILLGEYDQPAKKAPTTLGNILNMLRDCFRMYWIIQDGKLRIEHISWFLNGGSYFGAQQIGADLTSLINTRNGKNWGFNSSSWEFDKGELAERYEFSWMDDVTPAFEGLPIDIVSNYIQKGKKEDITISQFTTDVDYMLLNPTDVSKDGFALFGAVPGNALYVPDDVYTSSQASGTNAISSPQYRIKESFSGKQVLARFYTYSAASVTFKIIAYQKGNATPIELSSNITAIGSEVLHEVNITLPANIEKIAFRITSGDITFRLFGLNSNSFYELPFVSRTVQGIDYIIQNGWMSWITLQPNYYVYDMPAENFIMNGSPSYALGIKKSRKQKVKFPSLYDLDLLKLIKTPMGNGQVEKISVNLSSRINTVTLRYDTR